MKNEYMGHSLFNDVENSKLQAFNRARVVTNIKNSVGRAAAEDYITMIDQPGRMKMAIIMTDVRNSSWDDVGKRIRMETT